MRKKLGMAGMASLLVGVLIWQLWPEHWAGVPVVIDSAAVSSGHECRSEKVSRPMALHAVSDATSHDAPVGSVLPREAMSGGTPAHTNALHDEDLAVRCAAIGAWEAMKGEAAIPDIAKLLEENRERPDGYSAEVAEACVKALAATRASEALPALEKELQWLVMQKAAQSLIGYGNSVIEAVADIGDSRSATMLENFAEALQGKLSGMPTIRREQMLQMAEAYVKADELR